MEGVSHQKATVFDTIKEIETINSQILTDLAPDHKFNGACDAVHIRRGRPGFHARGSRPSEIGQQRRLAQAIRNYSCQGVSVPATKDKTCCTVFHEIESSPNFIAYRDRTATEHGFTDHNRARVVLGR